MGAVSNAFAGIEDFTTQNLLGGAQADAAREAAEIQAEAGQQALATQQQQFEQTREDLSPFRQLGVSAIEDPSSVINNPFFQALAADQEQRLLQSAAARGKVGAGGTSDDLTRNLLLLGNQFQQQDIQTGLGAATGGATLGQQAATNIGGILGNIGNVQAAGVIGEAAAGPAAVQDIIGTGTALTAAFSDIRLKDNIRFSHTEDGKRIYNWDWTEEAKGLVGDQATTGPIAQELMNTHPELVTMDSETGFYKVLV